MIPMLETEDLTLRVDGMRLPARWLHPVGAQPDGPVLVFLHEGLGSIGLWKDFPEALCQATGLSGFLYERQGHGAADPLTHWPRGIGHMEREADHILPQVLAAAGIDRFIHIGHSNGGSIALLHAARRPAGLLGVMVEAAHVFIDDITRQGLLAVRDAFQAGPLRDKLRRWHGDNTDSLFWAWNTTWLDPDYAAWDITERLRAIRCPVLAIQGEGDDYGSPRQVEVICQETGGAAVPLLLPQCGHVPHHQARDAVLEAMAEAVTTWSAPAAMAA